MFFRPNIPPKQEGYSRNNDTFLKIEGFWRDKKNPKTLDVMLVFGHGASGDTELFEKASNINGFQGGRVANNLYISPFRATVFKTAALFLYLNSSVVIRVRKPLLFPPRPP